MDISSRNKQPMDYRKLFFSLLKRIDSCDAKNDPEVRRMISLLSLNLSDHYTISRLEEVVRNYELVASVRDVCLGVPPSSFDGIDRGDIFMGTTESGSPFYLDSDFFSKGRNVFVSGSPGFGKSNLCLGLVDSLNRVKPADLHITVFEFKRTFRNLRSVFSLVLTEDDVKVNLFEPPSGVPFRGWANSVVDMIVRIYSLVFSEVLLMEAVSDFEKAYMLGSGDFVAYPSVFEFRDHVRGRRFKDFSSNKYKTSAVSALSTLIEHSGGVGGIFDCSRGISIKDLFSQNCVIEISSDKPQFKALFISFFFNWLYFFKKWTSNAG